jgi:FtsH-binding integral membrane protein
MKDAAREGQSTISGVLQFVFRKGLPLEGETLLFVLASGMDFLMTWLLLNYQSDSGRTWFVESNPVARYFLYSWGFDGLIAFKFASVALVVVICQVIARTRIQVARRLLQFATLVVIGVVVYSAVLLVRHT